MPTSLTASLRKALEEVAEGTPVPNAAVHHRVSLGDLVTHLDRAGYNQHAPNPQTILDYLDGKTPPVTPDDIDDDAAEETLAGEDPETGEPDATDLNNIDDFEDVVPFVRDTEVTLCKTGLRVQQRGRARLKELAPKILAGRKVDLAFSRARGVIAMRAGEQFALGDQKGTLHTSAAGLRKTAPLGVYTIQPSTSDDWDVFLVPVKDV